MSEDGDEDYDDPREIEASLSGLMEAYYEFKDLIKEKDPHLFERWKAGGFLVDPDIISMYPNANKCCEILTGESSGE